jgi:hypothetical protein
MLSIALTSSDLPFSTSRLVGATAAVPLAPSRRPVVGSQMETPGSILGCLGANSG